MAKAEKVPADFEVKLTLTREEAEALKTGFCSRIGGPLNSRRRHFDAINLALHEIKVNESDSDISPNNHSIYFE
jgi:hypothetical protein